MATLWLADSSVPEGTHPSAPTWSGPPLREWLAGDWAMLFSHPDDFQYRGLEYDRWLTILRDEFRVCGARPLASAADANCRDASWVSELTGDWRLLALHGGRPQSSRPPVPLQPRATATDVVDLAARLLRAEIASLPSRFVLIVDAALRRRGVLRYRAGSTTVSPLDLLALVSALRRRTPVRRAA